MRILALVLVAGVISSPVRAQQHTAENFCKQCQRSGGHCHGDSPPQCLNTFRNKIDVSIAPDGRVFFRSKSTVTKTDLSDFFEEVKRQSDAVVHQK